MQETRGQSAASFPGTEIFPGRVFALGGSEPAGDGRISWLPSGASGWLPFNCYVVRGDSEAIIVDTGVARHEQELRAGFEHVLAGTRVRSLTTTRYEPDTLINLPWIVSDFEISAVYGGGRTGGSKPLDYFDAFDTGNAAAIVEAASGRRLSLMPRGGLVGSGDVMLESSPTPLFVLETFWLYDAVSRSLFTSDSWAFVTTETRGASPITEDGSALDEERIFEYLTAPRFDWLVGCDYAKVVDELRSLYDSRVIDRICPSTGCIIEGQELVRHVFERTIAVVERLAETPYTDGVEAWVIARRERA